MALNIVAQIGNTTVKQGVNPLTIDEITVVLTFRDNEGKNYFGGQVVLTPEVDGVSFDTPTETIQALGIAKAKDLLSNSVLPVVESISESPAEEPTGVKVDSNEGSAVISAN